MATAIQGYGTVFPSNDEEGGNENETLLDNDDEVQHPEEDEESSSPGLFQQMVAECIGTCILTQIGCAGLCASTYLGAYDGLWQAAVVWLLGATLAISATASISGAHLNPAVSVSYFNRKLYSLFPRAIHSSLSCPLCSIPLI